MLYGAARVWHDARRDGPDLWRPRGPLLSGVLSLLSQLTSRTRPSGRPRGPTRLRTAT